MKTLRVVILLVAAMSFAVTVKAQDSSGNSGMSQDSSNYQMNHEQAGAMSNTISVKQVKEMMKNNDSSIVLLDVRNPEEITGFKVDGSVNIPLKDLESRISELNTYTGKTIAVISNSDSHSSDAQKILTQHGYTSKRVRGGVDAYRKSESY